MLPLACASDRPEGDAQKGAKFAYYLSGGNLALDWVKFAIDFLVIKLI